MSYLTVNYEDWRKKKEIKQTKSGRVDQIIDGLTLSLKDGTIIRLDSIDIPDRYNPKNSLYEHAAFTRLKELLPKDTEIYIFQTRQSNKGRKNFMGHDLSHIVTKDDSMWIQGQMLQDGLAVVYTAPKLDHLMDDLLKAEAKARNAHNGLWQENSPYKLLNTNNLQNKIGNFVVIEAAVKKVAAIRNNIYLNFGNDWKADFTIMINSEQRRDLAKQGINPLQLGNETVRVRGWLKELNGPFIELEDIAHLEILQNERETTTLPSKNNGFL